MKDEWARAFILRPTSPLHSSPFTLLLALPWHNAMASEFLEAFVSMLPVNAGGRSGTIAPRHGSYRPFARHTASARSTMLRIRFMQGPPLLAPRASQTLLIELQ